MKFILSILILLLSITTYGQRYRLVADTTYDYTPYYMNKNSISQVSHYRYKKGGTKKRSYLNPELDCDTVYRYFNNGKGLNLVVKEIRSFNDNGLVDTIWFYKTSPVTGYSQSITINRYNKRDKLISVYVYGKEYGHYDTTFELLENTKTQKGIKFLTLAGLELTRRDTFEYRGDDLFKETRYCLLNDCSVLSSVYIPEVKDSLLKKKKRIITYENNRVFTIEEYDMGYTFIDKETYSISKYKIKKFSYDENGNELSSNQDIKYYIGDSSTSLISYKLYNPLGNVIESYLESIVSFRKVAELYRHTYNENGQLVKTMNWKSMLNGDTFLFESTFFYDSMGRLSIEKEILYNKMSDSTQGEKVKETTYNSYGLKSGYATFFLVAYNGSIKKNISSKTTYTYEAY